MKQWIGCIELHCPEVVRTSDRRQRREQRTDGSFLFLPDASNSPQPRPRVSSQPGPLDPKHEHDHATPETFGVRPWWGRTAVDVGA